MTLLPQSRPLTYADLEAIPDDGHRYELLDGSLIVTPAPSREHQRMSSRLKDRLKSACQDDLLVLTAPTDVRLADDSALQPDLLVVDLAEFDDPDLPVRPLLVVEILSPSTRQIDLTLKKARYEIAGCPAYWVVDPQVPSITGWELRAGVYVEAGHATGEETFAVGLPFPIEIVPARLLD